MDNVEEFNGINILTIDSIAFEKMKQKYKDKIFVIDFKKTGCSGWEYVFSVKEETDIKENYDFIDFVDFKVAHKREDLLKIIGSTIKYKKSLFEEKFLIENPNVKNSCGCGKSINF